MADGGYGRCGQRPLRVSGYYEADEGKASRSVGAHTVRPDETRHAGCRSPWLHAQTSPAKGRGTGEAGGGVSLDSSIAPGRGRCSGYASQRPLRTSRCSGPCGTAATVSCEFSKKIHKLLHLYLFCGILFIGSSADDCGSSDLMINHFSFFPLSYPRAGPVFEESDAGSCRFGKGLPFSDRSRISSSLPLPTVIFAVCPGRGSLLTA